MTLRIRKIVIRKDNETTESHNFNKSLSVVNESSDLYNIIKLLLGKPEKSHSPCNMDFYAEAELDKSYIIRGSKKSGEDFYTVSVYEQDTECTDEYFENLKQPQEMDSALFFHRFRQQDYPCRLQKYKNILQYYPEGNFSALTQGYGLTRSFRGFISQYIHHYKPIRLCESKDLFIKLLSNGCFTAGPSDNSEKIFLSESENVIYNYLSFISIADFWDRADRIRNMHSIRKPLVVSSFLEHIDNCKDISHILKRTARLDRQTIILTSETTFAHEYRID